MSALGFQEVLFLLLLLPFGDSIQNDLVSFLDPADYFNSRRIEAQPKSLIELASKNAPDTEASVGQLLAIRWLGANREKLGDQRSAAQKALVKITEGPAGFARDHARLALAQFEGKSVPYLNTLPKDSVRGQGLEWFPEDVGMAGAFDIRPLAGQKPATDEEKKMQQQLLGLIERGRKLLPPEATEVVYNFADVVGNVRLDRVAMGYSHAGGGKGQIYVRFTGQANQKRLAEYIVSKVNDGKMESKKGSKGEAILLVSHPHPPAFAFIGDHELLMCGFDGNNAGNEELVNSALEIRDGKKPNVLKGPLAKPLQGIPAQANGGGTGAVPEELQRELARSPVGVSPVSITAFVTRVPGLGVEINLRGTMANEDEAKTSAERLKGFIKQGQEALTMLPPLVKQEWRDAWKKTLEGIEIKADAKELSVRAVISSTSQLAGLNLLEAYLTLELKK